MKLEDDDGDRISQLPDDVIWKIFSFLEYDSIRTSVLSKRWKILWDFAPNISLKLSSVYGESDQQFQLRATSLRHYVDNFFFLRDCLHIESFKLDFLGKANSFRTRASSWVCAVVMCNVRKLDLTINSPYESDLGELPWCLFTCKSLVVLKLNAEFILNVPHSVGLPNLKTLVLKNIICLGDAGIQKFLSGCPVLEDLEILDNRDIIWILNISVPSLKRLTLNCGTELPEYDSDMLYQHKVVVDAPNLEFMYLRDDFPNDILLKVFPKIVEAHVDTFPSGFAQDIFEYSNKMPKLLESIVNVRRLFLYMPFARVVSAANSSILPRFCNLVFLEIEYEEGPTRLMDFLRSSPNLETISFPSGIQYDRYVINDADIDIEFRMNKPEGVPQCLHHSLKVVQIQSFSGDEEELDIVKYLLKNAMVLQKITLFCLSCVTVELQAEIKNYPRLSVDCQIDVKPDP